MSKAIKALAIATIIAGFASVAVAQSPPRYGYPGGEGGLAATYAGDAATNQYTSRAGLVDEAP
jgi:hypothetical protein